MVDSQEEFSSILEKLGEGKSRLATIFALAVATMCRLFKYQALEVVRYENFTAEFAEIVMQQANGKRGILVEGSTWCDQRAIEI